MLHTTLAQKVMMQIRMHVNLAEPLKFTGRFCRNSWKMDLQGINMRICLIHVHTHTAKRGQSISLRLQQCHA